jgi:Uma2 family endonuclease
MDFRLRREAGMAHPQDKRHLSHEEYFALEQAEDRRYEYLAGEVFAMAGGSESHALISMNIGAALVNATRGKPCRVYGADMRVRVAAFDKFCYPDVAVVCSQQPRNPRWIEDPVLIVEVLSPGTESYDRGLKFEHYRALPSLRVYLLLSQDRMHAEFFEREGGTWRLREASGGDGVIALEALGVELPLAELYRQVDFEHGSEKTPEPPDERESR